MSEDKKPYPVSLSVDYPDRELNRLTSFFRLIVIIPIAVLLCCGQWRCLGVGGGTTMGGKPVRRRSTLPGHHAHAGLQTEVPALVV